jgi:hypothetical protein
VQKNGQPKQFTSEGALFRYKLGAEWEKLHPDVQQRFEKDPAPGKPLAYHGVMTRMDASPIGIVFAWGTRFCGCLQPFTGSGIPVNIRVFGKAGMPDIFKRRHYLRPGKKPFRFTSRMVLSPNEEVLELVGFGMGMVLDVSVTPEGNLHFHSRRYFFKLGNWMLPLPGLLTPGETNLTHFNINPATFCIRIDIKHPLYGQLFLHEGTFWEKGATPPHDYRDLDFTGDTGCDRGI